MLYKYEILNPVIDTKKPHVDTHGVFIIPKIRRNYKYFIEAISRDPNTQEKSFVLIFSLTKFCEQCKRCRVDNYGRLKVPIAGDLREYVVQECKSRGNVQVEYVESEEVYDVYSVE